MIDFLSDAWIAELHELVSNAARPPVSDRIVLQQEITGLGETLIYQIVIGPENCAAVIGTGEPATVVFRQTRAIAVAIAEGRTSAHEAFMLGQLEVSGDPRALISSSEAAAWLDKAIQPLRDQTSY